MKTILIIGAFVWYMMLLSLCSGQDLSSRVRTEILSQVDPIIVNVSLHSATTIQFPAQIQALTSDGFTTKPDDEAGDFYISAGINWVIVRALHGGAQQNLGVVIGGKVYEVFVKAAEDNDFSVLFRFPK